MKVPGFIAAPTRSPEPAYVPEAVAVSEQAADLSKYLDIARRRLGGLTTEALFDWTDLAVSGVGRAVSDMRKGESGGARSPQEEARLAAHTLALAVEELVRRIDS